MHSIVGRNFKNEDTWCVILGHFRCRIRFSLESIQRVVVGKALRTFATLMAICTSAISNGTVISGTGTTTGSTMISTPTTLLLCAQLFSFLFPCFTGRVLFCFHFSKPTAKHFSDLIYFFRKTNVFFIIQRLGFPKEHEKYF